MKKLLIVTLIFLLTMPVAFASSDIFVDGERVVFDDAEPLVVNDITYVPLRKVFEAIGAYVDWNGETNTIYATKRFNYLSLTLGDNFFYINGDQKELSQPIIAENGRTFVPLRVLSEAMGAKVKWNPDNGAIGITTNFGAYKVSDVYETYYHTVYDGTVVLTGRISYPELVSDSDGAKWFNDKMREYAVSKKEKVLSEMSLNAEYAYIQARDGGYEFNPHMAELNFDIKYNKDGIVSVVFAESNFAGGMHPDYVMSSVAYDILSKKLVNAEDRLGMSTITIEKKVKSNFEIMIESNPDSFYSDAMDCLSDAMDNVGWYLSKDGVCFYLNPYEIAPYAAGVIETLIN